MRRLFRRIDLIGITLWALAGSIAFGAACGAVFTLYLQVIGREITVVLLVLCGVLTGFAAPLGFEPFLAGLAAGLVIQNIRPAAGDVLHDAAEQGAMPALVLFFAATGASMHVEALATVGLLAVALSALRVLAVRTSIRAAVRVTGGEWPGSDLLWRALLPTAGTTLGLVTLAVRELPDWGLRLQALDCRGRRDQSAHRTDHLPRRPRAGSGNRSSDRQPCGRVEP